MKELETRYLERLSDLYPTIAAASTEIINLQAILNLPKGTEHFLTDIHGEWEAFSHVLKNGSGAVRSKIEDVFGYTLGKREKQELATLIYYPKEKTEQVKRTEKHMEDWYKIQLYRLIEVSKRAASKYTRSKVRKALPKDFAYVIEELITEKAELHDKESYYNEIIQTIIRIGRAEEFICAIADLIQRLVIDHLHIVGDIYDRGPGPHIIMDKLMTYHSVDIQWGNHDVLWMGAAAGQRGCIANVIRICARYGNLDILEEGYGINLLPLANFALRIYGDDPCTCFRRKGSERLQKAEMEMNLRMHKAISVIQFKVEGKLILQHPDSPLFGKDKMATFERYFIEAKETHLEKKNPYYELLEKEAVVDEILEEFGLHPEGAHIVNGHVPVKCKNGESPIKCNGKVLVIDGGFSRAYQKETGIAGYTLVYNSYGLVLVAHEPFESKEAAVEKGSDIHSDYMVVKRVTERRLVGNTDIGTELKEQVADLESLLAAYRSGQVIEKL